MDNRVKEKLKALEITQSEFWNINSETGSYINMLIKMGNYKNILELGTSNGYSAIWISLALQETQGNLVTIEFSKERLEMARKNLEECGLSDRVTFTQGKIIDILERVDLKLFYAHNNESDTFIDFAFIDASKLEYVEYFNLIHPKLKKNGIIVADNVISHELKVKSYIDLISSHEGYQSIKLNTGTGLLLSLKTK